MPLQFPNLSQIAAPMKEFQPESMTSVLMNIAKERRAEEQLALQKAEQARLQKQQEIYEQIQRKKLLMDRAQEQRLEMQRKAKQRQDALTGMWKAYDETEDMDAAWQQAVNIDPSLADLPEEQRIVFRAKGEEVDMVVPDTKGNVNTVTLPRKNVKDFQNDLFKNPKQPADQLVARYGGRMTGWKPAAEAGGGGKTSTAFNDVRTMYPGLDPNSTEFRQHLSERLWRDKKATDYAPDMEIFVNEENGQTMIVNTRDQNAVKLAESKGFKAPSPEARGYGMAIGKASAEREAQINAESAKARIQVSNLTAMDQLLDRFTTSKLAPTLKTLQSWANAFGLPIDVSNLSAKEAFDALANQLALQSRNMGEGMVLAGQMSDRDVQFLKDMNPQLMISKGGNKLIIQVRKRIAERQNDVAALMRKYKSEHGGRFDATDFDGYLAENFGRESIFGIPQGSVYVSDHAKTGLPAYRTPNGDLIIPEI